MKRQSIKNFEMVQLLALVCFLTNLSQLPFFVEHGLTQFVLYPVWFVAVGSIAFSKRIKLVKRLGFMSVLTILFFFGQLLASLIKNENYMHTSLSYPFYLSMIIFFIGYIYTNGMTDNEIEFLSQSYIFSVLIVSIVIYINYFMHELSLNTTVYAYASKNSVSQMIMTAIILLILVWRPKRIPILIFKVVVGLFLLFMLLILKSRASIIGLFILGLVIVATKWKNKYVRYASVAFVVAFVLLVIFNKGIYTVLINDIFLANRNFHDLDELSSGRISIIMDFPTLIRHDVFFGIGNHYFELFYLASILQHGIVFGLIPIAVAFYPLVWIVKNSKIQNKIDSAFIIITLCYLANGLFEGLAPFGPGAKCYFLWLLFGILIERNHGKIGKFTFLNLEDYPYRSVLSNARSIWKEAKKAVPYYTTFFVVNSLFRGNHLFYIKKILLSTVGIECGNNIKIVGPIKIDLRASVKIGDDCWIGSGFAVYGNGAINIQKKCTIGPEVSMFTNPSGLGSGDSMTGVGTGFGIVVNQETRIGAHTILMGEIEIGEGCVVESNSFLSQSVPQKCQVTSISTIEIKAMK